jgi:hypothetical protein
MICVKLLAAFGLRFNYRILLWLHFAPSLYSQKCTDISHFLKGKFTKLKSCDSGAYRAPAIDGFLVAEGSIL